ncbi:MAG: DUF1707 domain-containing protein [Actinomycetota bacterium]|nr:DUF1707 domain-containing protein [Actinomycetota bacterium]MDQ6933995.1 DUF1707 domain-containing protein [Actinomycetota bacterium]
MDPYNQSLRISDAEREASVSSLGEHYAVGRLTREEYDQRAEAAWAARTRGDLLPLFTDLEAPPPPGRTGRGQVAARPSRPWWHSTSRLVLVGLVGVLVALAVLTHLPWILVGLAVWFFCLRPSRHRGPAYNRRRR